MQLPVPRSRSNTQNSTADIYKMVVVDVLKSANDDFLDELGAEKGAAAVLRLQRLWVKKVQTSRVCELLPPPSPALRLHHPNHYHRPGMGGVGGGGWIPFYPQFLPSLNAHSGGPKHPYQQPLPPRFAYVVAPVAQPPAAGMRLQAYPHQQSTQSRIRGKKMEAKQEDHQHNSEEHQLEEPAPPRLTQTNSIMDTQPAPAAIPPPIARRIRILRPKMEPSSIAKLQKPQSSITLPQLDGAPTDWRGVGIDDSSSSSDDDEDIGGWDDFAIDVGQERSRSISPPMGIELGIDLPELTPDDDWMEKGDEGEVYERESLIEQNDEFMVCKGMRVVQRGGVWKMDFTLGIFHVNGKDFIFEECTGTAKF